ncbi:membrane protein PM19L [Silene latifolia]|uniref:membrane protein PM19L n=1 Tax=Silene latifolia TaxID=37657 RepID=UPI003D77F3E9
MAAMGKNVAGPLLIFNLILYIIVIGFASWCMNKYINFSTRHPGLGGNGATPFFVLLSLLAGVIGVLSRLPGATHVRAWRNDSLAAAGSASLIAWALTALAMGFAIKEISIGGWRGWRLKALEAFIIILTIFEFIYVMVLHAGLFGSRYGPGYRDHDYGVGVPSSTDPKGTTTRI